MGPTGHIEDDILDRYATGSLTEDLLPSVDEHLLCCLDCQSRLLQTDEFVRTFYQAASGIELHPAPFWKTVLRSRPAQWAGAAALLAFMVTFVEVSRRDDRAVPAVVLMQSLRGSDSGAQMLAGKPARLVFDLASPTTAGNCKLQIVDKDGARILETGTSVGEGRLVASVGKLVRGDYWARLYCGNRNELLAEYSLRSN